MKIVIDKDIPFIKGVFDPYAETVYIAGNKISAADIEHANALIIRTRTKCNANLLNGSSIKIISSATIGYDHIDTDYCNNKGITWLNAPGCNANGVKQYVVAALLNYAQNNEIILANKTIGIIGVGHVGSKIKEASEALVMNVLLNDPPRADIEGHEKFTDINTLAAQSDIITWHVPLTNGKYPTVNAANQQFFNNIKNNALFINTSRGEVVNEQALVTALANKKISSAIIDVWQNEPEINHNLLQAALTGTPHIAGYTLQGKANATKQAIENISSFFGFKINHQIELPLPHAPLIRIDCNNKTNQQIIFEAVKASYNITADSDNLKSNPAEFEKLRNTYNYRHEFESYTINLQHCESDNLKNSLAKLGFTVI